MEAEAIKVDLDVEECFSGFWPSEFLDVGGIGISFQSMLNKFSFCGLEKTCCVWIIVDEEVRSCADHDGCESFDDEAWLSVKDDYEGETYIHLQPAYPPMPLM